MRTILGHRGFDVHVMEEDAGAALMDVPPLQLVVLPPRIVLGRLGDGVSTMGEGGEIRDKK